MTTGVLSTLPFGSFLSEMTDTTRGLVTAAFILVLAMIAGFIVERILVSSIRKFAATTEGKIDDVIADAIKGIARWVFLLIGLYYAIPFLPIPESMDKEITVGFRIAVLVVAVIVVSRFASGIAAHYAHRLLPSSVSMAKVVVNVAVLTIGLLVIFQTMGIAIAPIITALGVGGLAVALALQDTLANFFAGINILATKQIRPGDYIRLDGGQEGVVYDVSWRTTTLRVPRNQFIIVPNTKLAQAIVSNFNVNEHALSLPVTVSVTYGSDLAKVERLAKEAANDVVKRVEGSLPDSEPTIRFHTFADLGIRFDVIIRAKEYTDQGLLRHELIKALQARFTAEGVEIPSPFHTMIQQRPQ
ncbi:MAG TPA: mechanosensitive ion channel family protein [Candidatus Krumholzibacteria bacterium]|nr:mechanosensitive ion channel family protein [Candidatus Krumholzibacteria bacterium]